jgi:hypothetical protein
MGIITFSVPCSVIQYNVNFRASAGLNPAWSTYYYYRINSGSWVYLGEVTSTSCTLFGTVPVQINDVVDIIFDDEGGQVYFDANLTSSCPTDNQPVYCIYSNTITGNTNISGEVSYQFAKLGNVPIPCSNPLIFNYCGYVAVAGGDLLDSTGNSSYPDNTVYVNYRIDNTDYTQSFTTPGTSYICGFYTTGTTTSYYYKNDVLTIGSTSVGFYDTACNTAGDCTIGLLGNFAFNASSCSVACTGVTNVSVYSTCDQLYIGCDVFSSEIGGVLSEGYYSDGVYCYYIIQYMTPEFESELYSRVENVTPCSSTPL